MMNKVFILLLMLLLASCAKPKFTTEELTERPPVNVVQIKLAIAMLILLAEPYYISKQKLEDRELIYDINGNLLMYRI